ncbi:MAG: hypothetical protein J5827_03940 [Oscillospiraceae bacterium]|nr:hypothetical protein [Oscillospiraceae bacterium]
MKALNVERAKSLLTRLGLLLILFFLQSAVFSRLRIAGACPLPLPLFAVCTGLFFGGLSGGCWGLAAGVLCDCSLGGSGLSFTLYLTALGFFCGFLGEFILSRGFPSFLTLSLFGMLLTAFMQSFKYVFFFGGSVLPAVVIGLIQTLYTLAFTIPIYLVIRHARIKNNP